MSWADCPVVQQECERDHHSWFLRERSHHITASRRFSEKTMQDTNHHGDAAVLLVPNHDNGNTKTTCLGVGQHLEAAANDHHHQPNAITSISVQPNKSCSSETSKALLEKRRTSNRLSARRWRSRKRNKFTDLQDQIRLLQMEQQQLKRESSQLQDEYRMQLRLAQAEASQRNKALKAGKVAAAVAAAAATTRAHQEANGMMTAYRHQGALALEMPAAVHLGRTKACNTAGRLSSFHAVPPLPAFRFPIDWNAHFHLMRSGVMPIQTPSAILSSTAAQPRGGGASVAVSRAEDLRELLMVATELCRTDDEYRN